MNTATLNVRILKSEANLQELERTFVIKKLQILGLTEVKRIEDKIITSKSGNVLAHSDSIKGRRGEAF